MPVYLSDRGFLASRGLSYTFPGTTTTLDAAFPITHNLGAVPSALELWVEQSAGVWEKHDPSTYVQASSTQLVSTGTTLVSVLGAGVNVRLVATTGGVAVSVQEATASVPGIVSTTTQTFAGDKTFNDSVTLGSSGFTGVHTINGSANFDTSTLFVDAANNRVGIRTNSPAFPLAVIGNASAGAIARFVENSTSGPHLTIESTSDGMTLYSGFNAGINGRFQIVATGGSSSLVFGTNSTERGSVSSGGNWTLGTIGSSVLHSINGQTRTTYPGISTLPNATNSDSSAYNASGVAGIALEATNQGMYLGIRSPTNSREGWIQVGHNSNGLASATGTLVLQPAGGPTKVGALGTGTVFSNGGTLTNTNPSDETVKNSIESIDFGLTEILAISPKKFKYNNDDSRTHYGFIAQEVEPILPQLISDYEEENGDTKKGLDIMAIFAGYAKAIQELNAKLDAAQAEIDALKSRQS